jgi:hypothetical protein
MHFNGSLSAENKFAEAWGQQDKTNCGEDKESQK